MQEDRACLGFLIDRMARSLAGVGITAEDEPLIRISLTAPAEKGIHYIEFDIVCEVISRVAYHSSKTLKAKSKW